MSFGEPKCLRARLAAHLCAQELFEFAHVLLFTTAVAYVKEIGLISRELNDIKSDFKAYEELEDSKAIIVEIHR